jgi:uncharacterized membrane protein YjjP (DUF1212 family)
LSQWRRELQAVDEIAAPYGRWTLVAAYAVSAFCISRLFKTDWPGSVIAALACATAQIVRATIGSRFNVGVTVFITAMTASMFSTIGLRLHYSETIVPTLTSSVALLIPSLWLVTGGLDIMGGQIRFGMTRMLISFLIFATIVTGIAFALLIVTWGST